MQHIHSVFPREPRISTSLMFDDPNSCLREQHIVSLITYTTDRVERSGHVGDLVPRAILVTNLGIHRHGLFVFLFLMTPPSAVW